MTRILVRLARSSKSIGLFLLASLFIAAGLLAIRQPEASAAQVDPRSLRISDPTAGAAGITYRFEVGIATPGVLGSIRFQFCENTSLVDDACNAPFGFDALNADLTAQTGETGFSIHPMSGANEIILTRPPTISLGATSTYTFTDVRNPAAVGTTFVRVYTHANDDGTGSYIDAGGLAFATNGDVSVSAEVPPFLLFCAGVVINNFDCSSASGDLINFGQLGSDHTAAGVSQMLAATNADGGYGIRVSGTTMTAGNNVITPMQNQFPNVGSSQFGLNLRANFLPNVGRDVEGIGAGQPTAAYNIPNRYRFANGEVLAVATAPDDFRKYTISYIVNVPKDQPGGIYAATMTYICLANF